MSSSVVVRTVPVAKRLACCALLSIVAAQAGCFDSASKTGGGGAKSGSVAGGAPNEAERLLNEMVAAYQKADSYADRGELRIAFRRDGRLFESQIPFAVILSRPNKLQAHLYQGHVVCDGKQLWAWTEDLPGYLLKKPMSAALTLGDVYSDDVMRSVLAEGQAGSSLQLAMLLGADAMELIRAGGEVPELLSDDEIQGRTCRRVRVRRADGNLIYWIDAQTLVLRRVEFPTSRALRLAAFSGVTDLTMTAEFVDPVLNPPQISPEAFQFDPPPSVQIVDKLDAFKAIPPPPPLSSALGEKVDDFKLTMLDGKPSGRAALAGKPLVAIFWSMDQQDSLSALDRLNALYSKFRGRSDVAFLAVNIDPAGDNGFTDKEIRDLLERSKVEIPTARDASHSAVAAFGVQFVPNLFLVAADGTVQDNEIGLNKNVEEELPGRIDRLIAKQSLTSDARARYEERVKKFEASQRANDAAAAGSGALPQAKMAPAQEPQKLKMTRVWKNTEIAKPGFVLAIDGAGPVRIIVADGLRGIAELNGDGKLVRKIELDLPNSPMESVISFWRTAVDKQGRRVFVGSAGAQQQLHVFDADFKRLLSFPEGTHAGISDVQLGDLDGDGEPELNVGYWGVVGVQNVALDGTRRWTNRRLPENVLRLAVTKPTSSGKRVLLCNTGLLTVAVLDDRGEALKEMPIGARSVRLIAVDDLDGDGGIEMCGIATTGPGTDTAVGFNGVGGELWNYPLPPGVHAAPEMQNEMIAAGKLIPNEPGMWIFAGADGTVHFVGLDGRPIDSFAWGEPLRGMAVATIDGTAMLVISDAKGVTGLRFAR